MKTIEQKARAYDEVIRKLRGMMPNWERLSYNGKTFLQDLIYIIPELAESEDEKIKNRLINLIKMSNAVGGYALHKWEADEMLAWIEKRSNTSEALEKFKTLQHITGDKKSTVEDWAYTPNLYHFDGSWHVDWISCEEGDSLIGFSAETPEEAIDKAYDWFQSTFCNS